MTIRNEFDARFMIELRYHEITKAFSVYVLSEIGTHVNQTFTEPFDTTIGWGIPLEIRVAFMSNGFRLIMNGYFMRTFNYVIVNGVYPIVATLEWSNNDEMKTTRVYVEEGKLIYVYLVYDLAYLYLSY